MKNTKAAYIYRLLTLPEKLFFAVLLFRDSLPHKELRISKQPNLAFPAAPLGAVKSGCKF
jgi:hypothetical protein